jgi:hypothetical protein
MILEVETQNSTYEIDTVGKRMRRITGTAPPSDRQGPNGVWKNYAGITKHLGRYLIDWDGDGRTTITSTVINETRKKTS